MSPASLPAAAAAAPLELEDLLPEILLRLPPHPSSLPRARAVSRRWRSLASDPRFCARFRAHHSRNSPLLGCFVEELPSYITGHPEERPQDRFQPALEAPNCVPKGRFPFPISPGDRFKILGCRHGLVLLITERRDQLLVWDPVTGGKNRLDFPPGFDMEKKHPVSGAVLRAAGDHFQVVLVWQRGRQRARAIASVYSSKTGSWGNLVSTPLPVDYNYDFEVSIIYPCKPAVMVGNSLYWLLIGKHIKIVEFDLNCWSLALIPTPGELSTFAPLATEICVIPAQGGGLGFLFLSEFSAQLWKRKTSCDGISSWVLGRTIALDKLLGFNSENGRDHDTSIIGLAEENNVVLLENFMSIFTVHLESLESKKIFGSDSSSFRFYPFEGVYTADKGINGAHNGAELLQNT